MTLPKIPHPTFTLEVPSTKKKVSFRPFLVKEEKILLMAKTSKDETDVLTSVKQIVNNCCETKDFDVNKIAIFDLEYLFLKIRANSIGNIIKLSYTDLEDSKEYSFEIDLNKIEVEFPEKSTNNKIEINSKTGILMSYPPASLYDDKEFLKSGNEAFFELIIRCIDKIYVDDTMYDAKDYKKEEVTLFVENLGVKTFQKIQEFLNNAPSLKHVLKYRNSNSNERTIELTTLSDFFTLR
jgi:T4 bacteriophage base plate protein